MVNSKLKTLMVAGLLVTSGWSLAAMESDSKVDFDVVKHIIKIEAEDDSDIRVFVDKDGDAQDFRFEMGDLSDLDAIAEQLSSLDEKSKESVLHALEQLSASGGRYINIEHDEVGHAGEKKGVFVVKSGSGHDDVHIDFDVDGDGEGHPFHVVKLVAEGDGSDQAVHKHVEVIRSGKGDMVDVIKRLIKKSKLTHEQIDELRQALNEKE